MNNNPPVVLVDDDEQILLGYKYILQKGGIEDIATIQDSRQVFSFLHEQRALIIVLDLLMPHISGIELLTKIKQEFPDIPVIVMTATNDIEIAIDCMREGAFDYLVKPVDKNHFVSSVKKAIELRLLRDELNALRQHFFTDRLENEKAFGSIITRNTKMLSVFHYVEAIAKTPRPILIYGETGVGKELLATSIFNISEVKGEFIAVNVAGLDDNVFSDTLFGHKKGAFTGADKERKGLIEQANEGILLLDEIGDLNETSQLKLLRLLEEKTYYPLGSDLPEISRARIIATTNRDLNEMMSEGNFRKDLYYRLCAHSVVLPPLRERLDDVPILFNHFLETSAKALQKKKPSFPFQLTTLLTNYLYPGNVRELQAMVYDAVARHKSGILSMEGFRKFIEKEEEFLRPAFSLNQSTSSIEPFTILDRFPTLKEAEKHLITEAMKRANGNQGIAASLLGISRQALNKRLNRSTNSL